MGHDSVCWDVSWVLWNKLRRSVCRSSASCRHTTISSDALDIPSKRAQAGHPKWNSWKFLILFSIVFADEFTEPEPVLSLTVLQYVFPQDVFPWNSLRTSANLSLLRWWYREGFVRALPWASAGLPGLQRWKIITKGDDGAICADHRSCAPAQRIVEFWKWCVLFFCGSLSLARIQKHLRGCTFRCKFEQQVQRYPFRGCGWRCCSCSRKKKDPNSIRDFTHVIFLHIHQCLWSVERSKGMTHIAYHAFFHILVHLLSQSQQQTVMRRDTANSVATSCCLWPQTFSFRSGEAFACAKAGLPSGGMSLGVGGFCTSNHQQLRPPIQHRDLKVENILKALGPCGKICPATLSKRSNVRMIWYVAFQ